MKVKIISVYCFAIAVVGLFCPAAGEVDCSDRPPHVDPMTCCQLPDIISDELKMTCDDYVMKADENQDDVAIGPRPRPQPHPNHHHHPHPPHHPCFMSCVINETGIMNDGKLDESALSEYLSSVLEDTPDMIPIVQEAFQMCADRLETMKAKMHEKMQGNHPSSRRYPMHLRCDMGAGMLMHCAFMETFKNCAAPVWNESDECNKMREYMGECMPPHGRHGRGRGRGHGHGHGHGPPMPTTDDDEEIEENE